MATIHENPTLPGAPDEPAWLCLRVADGARGGHTGGSALRDAAVARLLDAEGERERVEGFLLSAAGEGTDLTHLWAVVPAADPRVAVQACLALRGAGRTAAVFVSGPPPDLRLGDGRVVPVARATTLAHRVALIERACAGVRSGGPPIVMAQALVEAGDGDVVAAFERAGFAHLAELAFLRRPVARTGRGVPEQWGGSDADGTELVALADLPPASGRGLLRRALERSYEGTLDCPALCGMRTVDDVIDSHRAVGCYDPRWWWLVMAGSDAEGCLLLSLTADRRHAELVYVGVSPRRRAKGLGRALLRFGLARLSAAGGGVREVGCAVDTANTPALRLYARAGFARVQTRVALVRSLTEGGRAGRAV